MGEEANKWIDWLVVLNDFDADVAEALKRAYLAFDICRPIIDAAQRGDRPIRDINIAMEGAILALKYKEGRQ